MRILLFILINFSLISNIYAQTYITRSALDSLGRNGLLTEDYQGSFLLLYDHYDSIFYDTTIFEMKDYCLKNVSNNGYDPLDIIPVEGLELPARLNGVAVQKVKILNIPFTFVTKENMPFANPKSFYKNVSVPLPPKLSFPVEKYGYLHIPNTIKSLEFRSSYALLGYPQSIPNSVWYIYLSIKACGKTNVVLPVKTKKDHQFLGWYDASKKWHEDIEYDKFYKKNRYRAAFKYLKDDFYTLMEEDCIFFKHKIYENFYFGASKLKIPNSFNGEFILEIGDEIFREKGISELILPDSLQIIRKNAFSDNKLETVYFSPNIKSIGVAAFAGNKLETISFPKNIKSIRRGAFAENQLKKIIIPETIDTIHGYSFTHNVLNSVVIPKNIVYIGCRAFYKNNIANINLHNQLTYIGESAFALNSLLQNNAPKLPLPDIKGKAFLYWQSFKRGKYNGKTQSFEEVLVAKCQPGDKMNLNLGYKAVFEDFNYQQ